MAYTITSSKLGIVGDQFEPAEGVNIEALIEGGFIKSTIKAAKSDKPSKDTNEE